RFPMIQHEPVFCYLYETYDFPEARERIKGTRFEAWRSFGVPCGSKIAGFHGSPPNGSKHIFTLESIRLLIGQPFPFVNRRDWGPGSRNGQDRCYDILVIGDMGRIHVFKQANEEFLVHDVSY